MCLDVVRGHSGLVDRMKLEADEGEEVFDGWRAQQSGWRPKLTARTAAGSGPTRNLRAKQGCQTESSQGSAVGWLCRSPVPSGR